MNTAGWLGGRRIIVTGGASGIGAATVRAYARAGATVASFDVDDERGLSIAKADDLGPGSVWYRHCDVSCQAEVAVRCDEAVTQLGGLDVMANAAGIFGRIVAAQDVTEDEMQRQLDVHVKGTMFTNQAAFRAMRRSGGSIVNNASTAGVRGFPGQGAYAAGKGAILAWTRTAAAEWGCHKIRVNAVCPMIATPMCETFRAQLSEAELTDYDASLARAVPLGGRLGDPDLDLAPVMVFLASEMSRFITGQTLAVDGGALMLS